MINFISFFILHLAYARGSLQPDLQSDNIPETFTEAVNWDEVFGRRQPLALASDPLRVKTLDTYYLWEKVLHDFHRYKLAGKYPPYDIEDIWYHILEPVVYNVLHHKNLDDIPEKDIKWIFPYFNLYYYLWFPDVKMDEDKIISKWRRDLEKLKNTENMPAEELDSVETQTSDIPLALEIEAEEERFILQQLRPSEENRFAMTVIDVPSNLPIESENYSEVTDLPETEEYRFALSVESSKNEDLSANIIESTEVLMTTAISTEPATTPTIKQTITTTSSPARTTTETSIKTSIKTSTNSITTPTITTTETATNTQALTTRTNADDFNYSLSFSTKTVVDLEIEWKKDFADRDSEASLQVEKKILDAFESIRKKGKTLKVF